MVEQWVVQGLRLALVGVLAAIGCGSDKQKTYKLTDPNRPGGGGTEVDDAPSGASSGGGSEGGSDGGATGGNTEPGADAGASADTGALMLSGTLSKWLSLGERELRPAAAINDRGEIFLTARTEILVATSDGLETYLSQAVLTAAVDGTPAIEDLDVGPDGRLYLLHISRPGTVLVSAAAGSVEVYGVTDDQQTGATHLAVETPDRVHVRADNGLRVVGPNGSELLYSADSIGGISSCGSTDLTVNEGFIYYLPGCNAGPMYGGATDGSGIDLIATQVGIEPDFLDTDERGSFAAVGRAAGGAIVNFRDAILRVNAEGSFSRVQTRPRLHELNATLTYNGLAQAAVVEGPNRAIYLIRTDSAPPDDASIYVIHP
jgi:hypothetical protein